MTDRFEGERWRGLSLHLDRALELEGDERAAWLASLRRQDGALAADVEALLDRQRVLQAEGFLGGNLTLPPAPPASADGQRLGPYRVLRELGRGGMGRVYLAEQEAEDFRRLVALKVVEPGGADADVERRFRYERRILAGLEHPGIARFYDAGRFPDGRWFLALEYVEGEDLRTYVQARGLDLRARVALFLQVLDAVDFAHRRLVVHRDLKPGNVLVGADGRARLLDFGISKILDPEADAEATRTEQRSFTLAYASPEQLRGDQATIGTDVYSAGVVLYELLSGQRPFDRRQETDPDPPPPSSVAVPAALRARLAADLDAITLKALRPSADKRYPSASAFAADLRRWLAGEPVEAHRGGRRYRLAKFASRHRLGLAAAAAVLLSLAGGLSVALVQRAQARAAQARAEATVADLHALTQSMLFEIHEDVRLLPNSLTATATIVRRATEALDRLAATAGDDPRLLANLASGHERLGDLFGEHPALERSLAQPKVGVGHFERAFALRERLAGRPAAGFPERLAAARTLLSLAQARMNAGDEAGSVKATEEGIRRLTALEAVAPDPATLHLWLGTAHGRAYARAMRSPARSTSVPVHAAAAARAWLDFLAAPSPAALAEARFTYEVRLAGRLLVREGHPREALRLLDLGMEALDRGVLGGPESYLASQRRMGILEVRVDALTALHREAEALVVCKELLRLFTAHPSDADDRLSYAIASVHHHQVAAGLAAEVGDLEFADRSLAESERALAEAEGRYGAAAFARLRAGQEETRGDVFAVRADGAASPKERRRLRAAALGAYRETLLRAERLGGPGVHGIPPEDLQELRRKIERLERESGLRPPRPSS